MRLYRHMGLAVHTCKNNTTRSLFRAPSLFAGTTMSCRTVRVAVSGRMGGVGSGRCRSSLTTHLLVATLDGALALAQVDAVALAVAEDLDLHVVRLLDVLLNKHLVKKSVYTGGGGWGWGEGVQVARGAAHATRHTRARACLPALTPALPKKACPWCWLISNCFSTSSAQRHMKMPMPPPPPVALSSTGKPTYGGRRPSQQVRGCVRVCVWFEGGGGRGPRTEMRMMRQAAIQEAQSALPGKAPRIVRFQTILSLPRLPGHDSKLVCSCCSAYAGQAAPSMCGHTPARGTRSRPPTHRLCRGQRVLRVVDQPAALQDGHLTQEQEDGARKKAGKASNDAGAGAGARVRRLPLPVRRFSRTSAPSCVRLPRPHAWNRGAHGHCCG